MTVHEVQLSYLDEAVLLWIVAHGEATVPQLCGDLRARCEVLRVPLDVADAVRHLEAESLVQRVPAPRDELGARYRETSLGRRIAAKVHEGIAARIFSPPIGAPGGAGGCL